MPVGISAWTPLANITLSTTQTSVTFSSISGGFRDLVVVANSSNFDGTGALVMRMNSDTGNNYSAISAESYSTSTNTSNTFSNNSWMYFEFPAWAAGYTANIINIMDYSATDKFKTVIARVNNHATVVSAAVGRYSNTASVNSITLAASAALTPSFAAGSSFALYGVSA